MANIFLKDLKKTAARLGGCDPLWLKQRQELNFTVIEGGTTGPEMVLLHGLFGALSNWDGTFPYLQGFCRPLALQFPIISGHRSEVKVKSLAVFTEYLIRLRAIQPAILCGHSLGGHEALRLCLASPELVDCLILSGTSGLYEHSVDSLPVRPDKKFIKDHMERVFYNHQFVTENAIDEIYGIISKRMNVLNLIHAARSAKKDNLLELLKQINVPTLLLWGEDDRITTMEVARTFHKNIRNSKLVTIANCGHAPMIEHPQWFADQVQAFIKDNSRYYRSRN